MSEKCDVLIIGAGPAGLACGSELAANGAKVVILERKKAVGPKVCAGGITWDGLIRHLPETLIEKSFSRQYVFSDFQKVCVEEKNPIIATVNRTNLGRHMSKGALERGVKILTGHRVTSITKDSVKAINGSKAESTFHFKHLVGADGSSSAVRRYLQIPTVECGVGINFQVPGHRSRMEWHLKTRTFGYGYGWIFPHRESVSIGVYSPRGNMDVSTLRNNFLQWGQEKGYDLSSEHPGAELINYDYRGIQFNNVWLTGDAAGLASGLTGEGIYPAIVSGKTVAARIIDPSVSLDPVKKMVKKQKLHHMIIRLSGKNRYLCSFLMESLIFSLRTGVIDFKSLEMAS